MDKYLTLVNKEYKFDESMLEGLEMTQISVNMNKDMEFVDVEVKEAFEKLKKQLSKRNIDATVNSAGRTVEQQTEFFNKQVELKGEEETLKTVAKPGHSEHHLGLGLDINLDSIMAKVMRRLSPKEAEKMREKMYEYMHSILSDYGFILRYPADKEKETGYPHERWHIRYVGLENAKQMEELNMTLEEYLKYLKEQEDIVKL